MFTIIEATQDVLRELEGVLGRRWRACDPTMTTLQGSKVWQHADAARWIGSRYYSWLQHRERETKRIFSLEAKLENANPDRLQCTALWYRDARGRATGWFELRGGPWTIHWLESNDPLVSDIHELEQVRIWEDGHEHTAWPSDELGSFQTWKEGRELQRRMTTPWMQDASWF